MDRGARVRLVKETTPELPKGSLGTVEYGDLSKRGMVRVQWDCGFNIPMHRNELEPVGNGKKP